MLEKSNPILTYEGETEFWYFEWLREQINKDERRCANLVFQAEKTLAPDKYAKRVTSVFEGRKWYHILDKESATQNNIEKFRNGLKSFRKANGVRKYIKCILGYSNISFELWLLLHKSDFRSPVIQPSDYWPHIKKIFKLKSVSKFEHYKHEENFKKVLSQLTLEDVYNAIQRAKSLMEQLGETDEPVEFCKFRYYETNPSLSIHVVVEDILKDVGLIQRN